MLADIILPVLEDLCQHTKGEKIISINRDNFYKNNSDYLKKARKTGQITG